MSGLKSVDTMKVSSGMTTPSRPQTKNEKVSPDSVANLIEKVSPNSVASLFGLGSCDGGSGGSGGGGGGGGPGHGDGDPTFDREGRSMHWLNKALDSADPTAHQYWQIVYAKRLEVNGNGLEEAGDFISKLMSMGLQPIVGVTDRVDVNNDLVVKRQHQSSSTFKAENHSVLFEKVAKTDAFKSGLEHLAKRIVSTGRSMVPLALFQSLFRELSHTTPLTSAGCDLEQILRGIDHSLQISNVSVVTRAGDVPAQGLYARV